MSTEVTYPLSLNTPHVSLDIETLSNRPTAGILSIGAVKFIPVDRTVLPDMFYGNCGLADNANIGLHISQETVAWWQTLPGSTYTDAWMDPSHATVASLLKAFLEWLGPEKAYPIWGNGSAFDNAVVRHACKVVGMESWSYKYDCCARTLRATMGDPFEKPVKAHNALADALAQAKVICHYLNIIKCGINATEE